MRANISSEIATFDELAAYFAGAEDSEAFRGWARVGWSAPEGAALAAVEQQLKQVKLTIRNAPLDQSGLEGRRCVFSGQPARELVLVGRAY